MKCDCELRDRLWNGYGRCLRCGCRHEDERVASKVSNMTMITSTRSNKNADARRDFDGFNVDEELRRFREVSHLKQWEIAAELAGNLDEHMSRGGNLPKEWLGPECMQTIDDFKVRIGMAEIPWLPSTAEMPTVRDGDPETHLPRKR